MARWTASASEIVGDRRRAVASAVFTAILLVACAPAAPPTSQSDEATESAPAHDGAGVRAARAVTAEAPWVIDADTLHAVEGCTAESVLKAAPWESTRVETVRLGPRSWRDDRRSMWTIQSRERMARSDWIRVTAHSRATSFAFRPADTGGVATVWMQRGASISGRIDQVNGPDGMPSWVVASQAGWDILEPALLDLLDRCGDSVPRGDGPAGAVRAPVRSDGTFRIDGLVSDGHYRVFAELPGRRWTDAVRAVAAAGSFAVVPPSSGGDVHVSLPRWRGESRGGADVFLDGVLRVEGALGGAQLTCVPAGRHVVSVDDLGQFGERVIEVRSGAAIACEVDADERWISGRVADRAGQPVVGAEVRATNRLRGQPLRTAVGPVFVASDRLTVSAADGTFLCGPLPPCEHDVLVTAREFEPSVYRGASSPDAHVEITLGPAVPVTLNCLVPLGSRDRLRAHLRTAPFPEPADGWVPWLIPGPVNEAELASGAIRTEGLSRGWNAVELSVDGMRRQRRRVLVNADGAVEGEFVIEPARPVRLIVTSRGAPAPAARIELLGDGREAPDEWTACGSTDAAGCANLGDLALPAAAVRVSLGTDVAVEPLRSVSDGATTPLSLSAGGLLVVQVVDAHGVALPGAKVRIRDANSGLTWTTASGCDGTVRELVPPGTYDVTGTDAPIVMRVTSGEVRRERVRGDAR